MLPARRKLLGHAIAAQRVAGRRIEAASTVFNSTPTRRFAVVKEGGTHKHRDQNVAYLFNRVAGDKSEGWEAITLVTFVAATAIIVLGVGMGPETSLKEWAKDEALARDIREYEGKPIEYGKIYHQRTEAENGGPYFFETGDNEEDDDEDDDDDDDDDDDE